MARGEHVVRIHKAQHPPPNRIDGNITRTGESAISLVDHPDTCILCRKILDYVKAIIRRTVVYHHYFHVEIHLLSDNGAKAFRKVPLSVVDGHNN